MGFISRFLSGKKKFDAEPKDRVHTRFDEVRSAKAQGASPEEIEKLLELARRPENFYEVIGGVVLGAERVLSITICNIKGEDDFLSDKHRRWFWEEFVKDQKYCDEFFFGSEMRIYVTAKAWKNKLEGVPWSFVDQMLKRVGIDVSFYREKLWWRVACHYLAERGLEQREEFQKAWSSMTDDHSYAILKSLDDDMIRQYRLMD